MSTRGRFHVINTVSIISLLKLWLEKLICMSNIIFYCFFIVSGITRFDLLGDFGRYNWLGNFYIVFLYNMLFAGLTSASLIKTVTWAVQRELIRAFG